MKAGFVQFTDDFAEENIDFALALVDGGVDAEEAQKHEENRHGNERAEERAKEGDEKFVEGGIIHGGWPRG